MNINQTWRKRLESALKTSTKYLFTLPDGSYPSLNEEEFYGAEGDGFLSFMTGLVNDFRKAAYLDGYRDAVFDLLKGEDREKIGLVSDVASERAWLEHEKGTSEYSIGRV